MYILVKTPSGDVHALIVMPSSDIARVKTNIQTLKQIPPDQQRLIFDKEILEDQFELQDYGIQSGDTLELLTGNYNTSTIHVEAWTN